MLLLHLLSKKYQCLKVLTLVKNKQIEWCCDDASNVWFFYFIFPGRTSYVYNIFKYRRIFYPNLCFKKLKVKNTLKEFLTLSSPEKGDNDSDNVINNEEVTMDHNNSKARQWKKHKNRSRRSKRKSRRG